MKFMSVGGCGENRIHRWETLRAGPLDKPEINQPNRGPVFQFNNLMMFLTNQSLGKLSEDIVWGKRHLHEVSTVCQ